jgi:hypothetical protein
MCSGGCGRRWRYRSSLTGATKAGARRTGAGSGRCRGRACGALPAVTAVEDRAVTRAPHPAIVTVDVFTRVQLELRARRGGGLADQAKRERTRVTTTRVYRFRARVRCELCGRKMQGAARKHAVSYRCCARTLVPGSPVAADHPANVYLREDHLTRKVNAWIATLFGPENLGESRLNRSGSGGRRG